MKDINYVIQETARRTGYPEEVVTEVVRSAAKDVREFMELKKGYSIYFPRLGTFSFRVLAIRKYVERQRRYIAYWKCRLQIGIKNNNHRTIEAANYNIELYSNKIRSTLLIKQEFINDHSKYDKFKAKVLKDDTVSDIGRLDELLNVETIVKEFEERYKRKTGHL